MILFICFLCELLFLYLFEVILVLDYGNESNISIRSHSRFRAATLLEILWRCVFLPVGFDNFSGCFSIMD